jgi:tight adherence protein B
MALAVGPFGIFFGVLACLALGLFAFRQRIAARITVASSVLQTRINRADLTLKVEELALGGLGCAAVLWLAATILWQLPPVIAVLMLPLAIAMTGVVVLKWLGFKAQRRIGAFTQQLELVLRMMAGALRIGLGLRQSIIIVTEEAPDPARREFMRVIGRTNIGISLLDALDELAVTMPGAEVSMMARAIRVQAQTGGDLARVLDSLANTIKDRRRVFRKMRALTAQGRGGAFVIGALPLLVGGFVMVTQPAMGHAMLYTFVGHLALGTVGVLESAAIVTLNRIMQFDV